MNPLVAAAKSIHRITPMVINDWPIRKSAWNHAILCYRMVTCCYAVYRQKHRDARWAMHWMLAWKPAVKRKG